ncbi:iron chelate uptake ABC transporter family permease subunit [Frankia sp. CcI49]|uniref:FecCD family ABC transporter permease n=1 Tax=Frankia sp. CcI49 TaxID=1745382 RepID=UPI001F52AD12|nr:iron chelate uptake ABC transporter family permease subunit [Frankia sp. CcI49]
MTGPVAAPAVRPDGSPVPGRVLRILDGRVSARVRPRTVVVGAVLAALLLLASLWLLLTGDYPASPAQVVRTVFGDGPRGLETVVHRFRMPRLLVAIGVGAALAVSGGIFQSLARNPLGSPDVIGFTTCSATGALLVILVFPDSPVGVPAGALLGGLVAALVVYALAYRRGVQGNRLILVGLGVSAVAESANSFLLSRAALEDAQDAQRWLVGSVNGRGWDYVGPLWAALAVLLPVALLLSRRLAVMELGDDLALSLGIGVERVRLCLVVCGVALTAVATAAAGPIAFVALAAPQITRRLVGTGAPVFLPAALMGALIVTSADLAGQRLLHPIQMPVGLSTGAIGGVYLIWLLSRELRSGGRA